MEYTNFINLGHIAYLLNKPQNSRQVGSSLKHSDMIINTLNAELDTESEMYIDRSTLPWWRELLSSGKISPRESSKGQYIQADKLREEDVHVLDALIVDLDEYGWFPEEVEF